MSSKTANQRLHSAAWRISLWATLAFAIGTMLVFVLLHQFVADDIQRRSDAWLSGEVEVLGDVAERTPKDRLYGRVMGEVAELASREVPNQSHAMTTSRAENDSVFFLQAGPTGPRSLWVGAGDGAANLAAIRASEVTPDVPFHLRVKGVCDSVPGGGVADRGWQPYLSGAFGARRVARAAKAAGAVSSLWLRSCCWGLRLCSIRRGGCWAMCGRLPRRRRASDSRT